MGCGKTTIGKYLSTKTHLKQIDTDFEIEKLEHISIDEIFSKYKERYFRKVETKVLERTTKKSCCIISTGGGIFLKRKNRKICKKNGIIIFLSCPIEICLNRIKNKKSRPLLINNKRKIVTMFKKRQKIYRNVADLIIENNETPEKCTDLILKFLKLSSPRFEKHCN